MVRDVLALTDTLFTRKRKPYQFARVVVFGDIYGIVEFFKMVFLPPVLGVFELYNGVFGAEFPRAQISTTSVQLKPRKARIGKPTVR